MTVGLFCDIDLDYVFQASPSDPENFPFVVLGNKVDVDGGNSRVVCFTKSFSKFQSSVCLKMFVIFPSILWCS